MIIEKYKTENETKTKIVMFIVKCNTLDLQKNIYRK